MPWTRAGLRCAGIALAAALLAGCTEDGDKPPPDAKPANVGAITMISYDGVSDDLLTAGLGRTGLGGTAPIPANPVSPTAAELRKLAIFSNYTALVDVNPKGGYGTLFGPNIDATGADTLGEGKVAGNEYLAYLDDGTGRRNVTLMVQIPSTWNRERPCVVTATSSGSRGIYGAIGTAGEWGLKRGCAVPGAEGVQLRVSRPDRRQARAFATESREGLGQQHARRRPARDPPPEPGTR
jgi:hydroxybutyrate-dimer hydrolase